MGNKRSTHMEFYNRKLIEKYGAFAFEKQLFFAGIVEKMDWNVDIKKGEISFGDHLTFPMQILGTFSHSSETWLWAWANKQSGIPEKFLEHADKLKKYGDANNIDFLKEDQFEIERDDMHYIGLIALGITEANGYYLGNYGAGTMCLTINTKENGNKFPNDHISIFTVFPQLISQFEVNHKEAFVHYLNTKQYVMETNENEIIGTCGIRRRASESERRFPSGKDKVKATFDNLDRLAKLESILEQ